MNVSCWCGAPIDGAGRYLCRTCESTLVQNLGRVPSMIEDLDVEVTRQAVKACSPGTASGSSVGFDVLASELRDGITAVLVGLETIAGGRGNRSTPAGRRVHTIRANMPRVIKNPSVTGWHADLTELLRRAAEKIDQPAERVDLGECECGARLVTVRGMGSVRCRFCGVAHDVAEVVEGRRDRVLDELAGAFLTVRELVDALALMGHVVKARTVKSWAERGRLTQAPGGEVVRRGGPGRPSRRFSVEDAVECAEKNARVSG